MLPRSVVRPALAGAWLLVLTTLMASHQLAGAPDPRPRSDDVTDATRAVARDVLPGVIAANPAPPEKPKAASKKAASKKAPTGKNATKERRGEKRKDAAAESLRTQQRKRQTPEKQNADKVKKNNARKGNRKDNAKRAATRAARRNRMVGDDLLCHIHGTTGAAMTMNSRRLRALTPGSEAFKECARDVCKDLECGKVTNRDRASMVRDFIEEERRVTDCIGCCGACGLRDPVDTYESVYLDT